MKRSVFDKKFLLTSLVVLAFLTVMILSTGVIFAADEKSSTETQSTETVKSGGVICEYIESDTWKSRCTLWLGGLDRNLGENDITIIGQMLKWILLFIIIILIYSAFNAAGFPEKTLLKIILSIVVGFMASFLITTRELLTMMQGYTALGVTLGVFLPFMILGFFTIMVAKSMNPIGIYLQKVVWIIFSVYLLIKTWTLWSFIDEANAGTLNVGQAYNVNILFFKIPVKITQSMLNMVNNSDQTILLALAIASIASLFIMLSNKLVIRWFAKEELDAAVQAESNKIRKSNAYDSIRAQELDADKKVR